MTILDPENFGWGHGARSAAAAAAPKWPFAHKNRAHFSSLWPPVGGMDRIFFGYWNFGTFIHINFRMCDVNLMHFIENIGVYVRLTGGI